MDSILHIMASFLRSFCVSSPQLWTSKHVHENSFKFIEKRTSSNVPKLQATWLLKLRPAPTHELSWPGNHDIAALPENLETGQAHVFPPSVPQACQFFSCRSWASNGFIPDLIRHQIFYLSCEKSNKGIKCQRDIDNMIKEYYNCMSKNPSDLLFVCSSQPMCSDSAHHSQQKCSSYGLHSIEHLHPLHQMSEDNVFSIQPWTGCLEADLKVGHDFGMNFGRNTAGMFSLYCKERRAA